MCVGFDAALKIKYGYAHSVTVTAMHDGSTKPNRHRLASSILNRIRFHQAAPSLSLTAGPPGQWQATADDDDRPWQLAEESSFRQSRIFLNQVTWI